MALLDFATRKLRYRQLKHTIDRRMDHSAHGKTCLNVGGGYGDAHELLSNLGFEVTTCDVDGSCAYCDLNARLPYADNSFDLVVCLAVLEHLDDWQNGLRELKRVAKQLVIATTPSVYGKPVLETLAAARMVNKAHIDDHKYYLTRKDLLEHGYEHRYFTLFLNQLALLEKAAKET